MDVLLIRKVENQLLFWYNCPYGAPLYTQFLFRLIGDKFQNTTLVWVMSVILLAIMCLV